MAHSYRPGAADEELFMKEFESVPKITIYSSKDLSLELTDITTILSDATKDWEKRTEAIKRLRSLILAGATDYEEFFMSLKLLELACQISLKDLRSRLVRETCITIAFMSTTLGSKIDRFCEGILQPLFDLIPNSAKIMSSSAIVCIRFLIEYTHSPRLVPLYCTNMSSKNRSIRKACCEFLDQMLHTWPTSCLEKHMGIIQEAIKKGITDAESEARSYARKAFWGFSDHFRDQADAMMSQLDSQKQKLLYGEVGGLSGANSTNSVSSGTHGYTNGRGVNKQPVNWSGRSNVMTSSYHRPSVSNSNSIPCLPTRPSSAMSAASTARNRSKIPVFSPKEQNPMPSPVRYASAIDVGAARRARARAVIQSAMNQPNSHNWSITSRVGNTSRMGRYDSPKATANVATPERGRTNGRVSMSQPNSRSTSPSSTNPHLDAYRRTNRRSGIPHATSRDPSPSRGPSSFVTTERGRRISDVTDNNDQRFDVSSLTHERLNGRRMVNSNLTPSGDRRRSSESSTEADRTIRNELLLDITACINSTLTSDHFNSTSVNTQNVNVSNNSSKENKDFLIKKTAIDLLMSSPITADMQKDLFSSSGDINCLDVLKPVIGELPHSQAAIKMLTKLVEQQPKEVVIELLPEMMPALVTAYDSPEIAVRKAAVFAIVAIHNVVGEVIIKQFLTNLNGSKMKLLNLYIERSKSASSRDKVTDQVIPLNNINAPNNGHSSASTTTQSSACSSPNSS